MFQKHYSNRDYTNYVFALRHYKNLKGKEILRLRWRSAQNDIGNQVMCGLYNACVIPLSRAKRSRGISTSVSKGGKNKIRI